MDRSRRGMAKTFLELHSGDGCFLMPNAWDAGSAKMLAAAGFETIGTTSAGIAFSMGRPDNGFCSPEARVDKGTMLGAIRSIAEAVSVPVNADLEGGFGESPTAVAEAVEAAIGAGAVGGNIEDYTGNPEAPLFEVALAVERIAAARAAIDRAGIPFVLTGRTDRLNIGRAGGFAEAIERANRYREAGADCLFVPGVSDLESVSRLVREIDGPINVVMGLSGSEVSVAQLEEAGVRRISIGGSLARSMYFHIRRAADEMLQKGTFSYARDQVPQLELNELFER